ncbi:DUF4129 domain-containing protein [Candidatus Bipolaricaulota bacterium]|nr:DUF4129 domain-containing protein [Candidatus Bipolaricaulota bacterium]
MSKPQTRAFQLALVAFTAILIVLILPLIGNIHDVEFLPGREMDMASVLLTGGGPPESAGWLFVTLLIRVLLAIAVVVFVFQLIVSKEARKVYLVLILILCGVLLATEFFGCDRQTPEEGSTFELEGLFEKPVEDDLNLQPIEREVEASNFQYIILAIVLSSIVVILGGILLLKWFKARPQPTDDGYDEILDSITDAAHRIRAGEDPYTVVLFCYQEMIRILGIVGGIDATYLTPREFELRLRGLGLSGDSIAQLTGIFEIVRYAGRVDDSFAARALACLDTIQEDHTTDEQ